MRPTTTQKFSGSCSTIVKRHDALRGVHVKAKTVSYKVRLANLYKQLQSVVPRDVSGTVTTDLDIMLHAIEYIRTLTAALEE